MTGLLLKEMMLGSLRRVTMVIKMVDTGVAVERFLIDLGYLEGEKRSEAHLRETRWV